MSEEKLVTYKDLSVLRRIKEAVGHSGCGPLVDRLIAAAEANRPALPEGWYAFESVMHGTLHVYVKGGMVSVSDECMCDECCWGRVSDYAHRLTLLSPTVTPEPPPALEDGIYEVLPDEGGDYRLRYVRDGRCSFYRCPDGTLFNGGHLLPADVSTWRRIDGPVTATPKQIEEAARVVSGYPKESWAEQSEVTKRHYLTRTRAILAAAGIEVSHDAR